MKTYEEMLEELAVWFDEREELKDTMEINPSYMLRRVIQLLMDYDKEAYELKKLRSAIGDLIKESHI